ncbi:MAG: J domain-containing protein [Thermoplasmata archaeon]|nr:J domain-containing protein [Thermoplasmata archaeon]MCI4356912.1 J domain-containing protein [Thermoplasmata archaeon]
MTVRLPEREGSTVAKRDYYDVLGVARTAPTEEIKTAYRKLARQHHPDVNRGNPKVAEEKFKELSEAYEVLLDPEKRRRYDAAGFGAVESDFGPGGFTWQNFTHRADLEDLLGSSDFLEQLLRQGFVTDGFLDRGERRAGPGRGRDVEVAIRLPLSAAVHGAEPTIEVPSTDTCQACQGNGSKDGTELETCPECEGRGQIRRSTSRGYTQMISVSECPTCHGTGRRIKVPCPVCAGRGTLHRVRQLLVKVPPGLDDGSVVRLLGQGGAGAPGGKPGDLFVHVEFEPDSRLRRDGRDAFVETDVPLPVLLLGGEVRVPTVTGEAMLKIPAGTQPEAQFRLRGEGFPTFRGGGRGDVIVQVHAEIPRHLTTRQKELVREAFGTGLPPKPSAKGGLFGRRG